MWVQAESLLVSHPGKCQVKDSVDGLLHRAPLTPARIPAEHLQTPDTTQCTWRVLAFHWHWSRYKRKGKLVLVPRLDTVRVLLKILHTKNVVKSWRCLSLTQRLILLQSELCVLLWTLVHNIRHSCHIPLHTGTHRGRDRLTTITISQL